jgi:hypothetical protein
LIIRKGTLFHELINAVVQNTFGLQNVPGKIVTPFVPASYYASADDKRNQDNEGEKFIAHDTILPLF